MNLTAHSILKAQPSAVWRGPAHRRLPQRPRRGRCGMMGCIYTREVGRAADRRPNHPGQLRGMIERPFRPVFGGPVSGNLHGREPI